MKKSIKKNYLYNLIYQLIIIILPIITTPYLARTLGANGTGTFGYTVSIVTYFILFGSLGLSLYGQREIAYVQNDRKKRSKIFLELAIFRMITIFLSTIIYYFLFARNGQYSFYYKILLLDLLATGLDISWFFQGIEDFKKIVLRNLIIKILSIISIFVFIHTEDDLAKYIFIYVASNIISNFLLWINIHKYIDFNEIKNIEIKKHIRPILILFIPQIAIQIYTVLDKTMIGLILDDMSEVGYYEQAQKIIKMLMTVITSFATVMLPRIASFYVNGEHNKIKDYMHRTFNFIYFLGIPMICGIIVVAQNFVPIFFGKGFDEVVPIMQIMSLIVLFIGFSGVIGNQFLLATKKQKEFTESVILGCVINFVLNLILIAKYKSIGATIATVIAEFSVMAIQFWFIRKNFNIKEIIKLSRNYVIAGMTMIPYCMYVNSLFSSNFKSLLFQVIVGVIIYFGMLLLMKDKLLIYFINVIGEKVKIVKKIKEKTIDKISDRICKIIISIIIIIGIVVFSVQSTQYIYKYKNIPNSTNLGWKKYGNSQVLGNEKTGTLFDPTVIIEDGKYIMYVSSRANSSISISQSEDGYTWSEPVIVFGPSENSKWDKVINRCSIVKKDGKYYMYYTGQEGETSKIGVAVSEDGINFEKMVADPVIIPEYDYEGTNTMNPYVIWDEEEQLFKMWYAAGEYIEPDAICYATSTDGINWKKYDKNPIIKATNKEENYDNYKVGACEVYKLSENDYLMFYIGYTDLNTARIFYAKSEDGINWRRKSETPIISPSNNAFDSDATYKPTAVYDKKNNQWLLWYNGRTEEKEYIGLAICEKCKFEI